MAASVFESQHLAKLFPTGELGRLFTDTAEMRALLIVEGALAKVQGELGVIPAESGAFLHRASMEIQIDPSGLAEATGANGVSIPALLAATRKALEAPEHAQYLHWGATSQDIHDTALMLRLKQAFSALLNTLKQHITNISELSDKNQEMIITARTWGQHATPTSFGAITAAWGQPLLALYREAEDIQSAGFWVSLSGAAGTSSALGPKAAETRAALAKALGLTDPQASWHSDRTPITRLGAWATRLNNALAKMGQELAELSMTGIGEVTLGSSGGSSTMPQKQNPVAAGVICALAAHANGLNSTLQAAAAHAHQRDGAAWISEWIALPQLILGAGAALAHAEALSSSLNPNPDAMLNALNAGKGLIYAEALSFALAQTMPRPEAQQAVKELCKQVGETGQELSDLAAAAYPDLAIADIFTPSTALGAAPDEARTFVAAVKAL